MDVDEPAAPSTGPGQGTQLAHGLQHETIIYTATPQDTIHIEPATTVRCIWLTTVTCAWTQTILCCYLCCQNGVTILLAAVAPATRQFPDFQCLMYIGY